MTEDELKSILAAHARDFANGLVELIRNAPLEEIAELTGVTLAQPESDYEEADYEEADYEEADYEVDEEAAAPAIALPVDENEVSILEHLNGAGPRGSTLPAWIISTHGELEPDEHAQWEETGRAVLDSLVERGIIAAQVGHKARGTVYTLLPV